MIGKLNGIHPTFRTQLLRMESECGFKWHITSGARNPKHNKKVGGVSNSAHVYNAKRDGAGVWAADISAPNSWRRYVIVAIAIRNGIKRIGIGKTFVHLDDDKTKPKPVMWTYK